MLNPGQGEHQNGRLCRSTLPAIRNTTSNVLSIRMLTNRDSDVGAGFRLTYAEMGLGCGGRLSLSEAQDEIIVASPNYPRIPPAHAECEWVIMAPAGRAVQLDFVENFYIT